MKKINTRYISFEQEERYQHAVAVVNSRYSESGIGASVVQFDNWEELDAEGIDEEDLRILATLPVLGTFQLGGSTGAMAIILK